MTDLNFTEIMLEFAKLNARLDKIEQRLDTSDIEDLEVTQIVDPKLWDYIEDAYEKIREIPSPKIDYTTDPYKYQKEWDLLKADNEQCFWVNMSPEDRMKPMSLSCPCKRCSPMSCAVGPQHIQDTCN